jgi:hypothetical protein
MLFNKGNPMINYEDYKLLFKFLKLKKIPKKHWNDMAKWSGLLSMFTIRF